MKRMLPLAISLIALLSACSAAPVPGPSGTVPSPAPASSVPTLAPTLTLPPANLLPNPLYVLDRGQIARIEHDGRSRALVTRERIAIEGYTPISAFAVGPRSQLAYVVGDRDADRLVRADADGGNPQIVYSQPEYQLSDLLWSPDATQIYLRLLNNKQPPDIPSGIYRIGAAGGSLELVRADDPVDDPVNPAPTINGYRPFAWSPDGSRLLVEAFSLFYDGCALESIPEDGGAPVRLRTPDGTQTYCGEAAWSPDGAGVYFLAGPPPDKGVPSLWLADTQSGASRALLPEGMYVRAPAPQPDGGVLLFLVLPPAEPGGQPSFTLATLPAGATEVRPLGTPMRARLDNVRWAATGAAVRVSPDDKPIALMWISRDASVVTVLPSTEEAVRDFGWGNE